MAFKEDFSEFFDPGDFAVEALYKPHAGKAMAINVIFDNEYIDVGAASVSVEGTSPVARCAAADVPNVAQGDELTIGAILYKIINPQPDGTGEILLILEVQD